MNTHAYSEKGFSLIELLVVVAIIGVLAAVGVVGYQGYIDSTKKSVTEANAKAVQQWILNTKTVRAAGIDTDPTSCKTIGSAANMQSCIGDLGASNGPFESFKNAYDSTQSGAAVIMFSSYTSAITANTTTCDDLATGATEGDIIIHGSGTNLMTLETYFCIPGATASASDVVDTRAGWTVSWN